MFCAAHTCGGLTEAAGAANATRGIICSLTEEKSDAWLMENFDPEICTDAGGRVPWRIRPTAAPQFY